MTWPQDAWALRSELISHSPYLSEAVLLETAERNILPQAMLLEVCLANPEGTRSEQLMRYLEYEMINPLPQYMLELIRANWNTETVRTLMEGSLAFYGENMAFKSDLLLTDMMLDSNIRVEDINTLLTRRGTLSDRYQLIENYIDSAEFTKAENLYDSIPLVYTLKPYLEAEHADYLTYFNLRKNIKQAERSIGELEGSEFEILEGLANTGTGRASTMASNILCFFYDICRDIPVDNGGANASPKMATKPNKIANSQNSIQVFPNPAQNFATFQWKLLNLTENTILIIKDLAGRTINTELINEKQNHWLWDTREIANGLYLYEVMDGNKTLLNGKIVINK